MKTSGKKPPPIPDIEEDSPVIDPKSRDTLKKLKMDSIKKHKYNMMRLDHFTETVSHPGFLFSVTFVIVGLYAATRYTGLALCNKLLIKVSEDLRVVLTYIGTVVITHIVTRFLEARKKKIKPNSGSRTQEKPVTSD